MLLVLFLILRENQDVIDKHKHKLVQTIHEDLIHEVYKVCWGVGQSKGHHYKLIQTITGDKSGLENIRCSNLQLMVT